MNAQPTIGTGQWSEVSGNAVTFVNPNNYTTKVFGFNAGGDTLALGAGTYVFQYTITNGGCSASSNVTLYVSGPPPSVAHAGITKGICGITSVAMNATTPTSGTGLWTEISGPNTPTIITPSSPTTNITNLITGQYLFQWTVTGGGTYCTPTSALDTVNVTLSANAGADQSYCDTITTVDLTGTLASTGTWTQVGSTPSVATITKTSGNTATASNLVPGVYTFVYTISTTGCSSTDTMKVTLYNPPSRANAGADQILCNASSFTLNATNPTFGTGTWSLLSGPGGGSFSPNANTYNATYNGATAGIYVFKWTVSNNTCSNADQVRITNYAAPSAAIAGPNQNVTCDTMTTMAATNPAIGLGTWTFISKSGNGPTPTITNPLLYNSTITGLGPTITGGSEVYTFVWTVSNGTCPSNTDTVRITVYQTPTIANAGPDQFLCNQSSFTMDGNTPSVGSGTWTWISGPNTPTITTPSSPTSTVTGTIAGTYAFKWTISTAFCSSSDTVIIINYGTPTTANVTGTPTSYCTLVPIELEGNTPTAGIGTWTQISGSALTILSPHSPTTTAIGGTTGNSYRFKWTITNGTCPSTSADTTVTMYSLPSQANAGTDQTVCNPTASATLAGNTPTPPSTGLWTVVSGPNTPSFTSTTSPTATVSVLIPGTYTLVWSNINGSCSTSDTMQITVYGATTQANAGPNQDLCDVSSFTMAGNTPLGSGEIGIWVRISGPNNPTITSPNSPTTTITGTVPGTYVFRWRITGGSCPFTQSYDTIINRPAITITGPSNASICTGGTQTLVVSASGGTGLFNYQWQYNNGSWTNIGGNSDTYTTPALTTDHTNIVLL